MSPWDYEKTFGSVSCGLLPELKLFDPISNVLEEEGGNKCDSSKIIKTTPLLFPVETEELPTENIEPNHTSTSVF